MRDSAWDWQVGVFGRNEASRIGACVTSIARAARGQRVLATVLLNGCTDNSAALALRAAKAGGLPVEIYRFAHADKANAINRFFYDLRAPAANVCCVDAYAAVGPSTLSGFAQAFADRPDARLATGIAANGRSEPRSVERTLTEGGVTHGQLYAPGRAFLDRLTRRGLRLPVGLYRGDGLLGSMAAHDLDPLEQPWENRRVVGVRDATYEIASLSPWRPADVRRHLKRRVNHMRGLLENAAIKEIIYARGYAALPERADDMIRAFLSAHGSPPVPLPDRPFMAAALRRVRAAARPPDPAGLLPVLAASTLAPRTHSKGQPARR